MQHGKDTFSKTCKRQQIISRARPIIATSVLFASALTRQTAAFNQIKVLRPTVRIIISRSKANYVFQPALQENLYSSTLWSVNIDTDESQILKPRKKRKSAKKRAFRPLASSSVSVFEGELAIPTTKSIPPPIDLESVYAVISCSLLVTGNTIGAGMIVLPEVAAEPGLLPSLGLFAGIFVINLISGLTIAEVAIKQYEENIDSNKPAPSSFKDLSGDLLAYGTINGANLVSVVAILINWCVLSFDFVRSGELITNMESVINIHHSASLSPMLFSEVFASFVVLLGCTQSINALSRFASGAVTLLFVSYGALLLPGLTHMQQDVVTTLFQPGRFSGEDGSGSIVGALSTAAPIILTTMVYQNIVPTVAKMMGYDRNKTFSSLCLGSAIPVLIYIAWCVVVLGGGVTIGADGGGGLENISSTLFSIACIGGSSISCLMSLTSEINSLPEILVKTETNKLTRSTSTEDNVAPTMSVLLAVIPSLVGGLLFAQGDGFTAALRIAGSYGSPLLYGVLPVILAYQQREYFAQSVFVDDEEATFGAVSQMLLGLCSATFIAQCFVGDMSTLF